MGSITRELARADAARPHVWRLYKDGALIKEFPTRDQCAVEAFERGWVWGDRHSQTLVAGVEICEGRGLAKYDQGGGCPCGVVAVCGCGAYDSDNNQRRAVRQSVFVPPAPANDDLPSPWIVPTVRAAAPIVIALYGPAGCGKSTVATYLATRYGFVRHRFADPMKNMMRVIGLTDAEIEGDRKELPSSILMGRTPRHAMQRLGTEFGRDAIHPDFWVTLWARKAREAISTGKPVVVEDLRFANEAVAVHALGGVVVRIDGRGDFKGGHVSEAGGLQCDDVLKNDHTMTDLYSQIDELWRRVSTPALAA